MSQRDPKLTDFSPPVTAYANERWWPQIKRWQREGLVGIKPVTAYSAIVSLTPKGRAQAGLPPIADD